MYKILLWVGGNFYERILNQVNYEIEKGNICVIGMIVKQEDKYCKYKDGFLVLTKNEIEEYEYDYIVSTVENYSDILREAMTIGIDRKRIIDGHVLFLPLFDFAKYAALIENPVTIISNDCWSGFVYRKLRLPLTSPFINIQWDIKQFSEFILDPIYYLQSKLEILEEGDIKRGIYPIGRLGDGNKKVQFNFIHSLNGEDVRNQWDRRLKRVNYNNIFIKMGFRSNLPDEEKNRYIDSYRKIKQKKILFYYGNDVEDSFKTDRFISYKAEDVVSSFNYDTYMQVNYHYDINLFDLLLYGDKYSRCQ